MYGDRASVDVNTVAAIMEKERSMPYDQWAAEFEQLAVPTYWNARDMSPSIRKQLEAVTGEHSTRNERLKEMVLEELYTKGSKVPCLSDNAESIPFGK